MKMASLFSHICPCLILVLMQLTVAAKIRHTAKHKPNIILIMVDDLGWDDVSFHGNNQIATPNIDTLAFDGVIMNLFYVQPSSTATRAALLTGKYPIYLGLQSGNIEGSEPYGLPLKEKLLPHYLKEQNYATHLVGKWHLGFYAEEYLPTKRGYDSHYGSYQAWVDPWKHTHQSDPDNETTLGHDWNLNGRPDTASSGKHVLNLMTDRAKTIIDHHDHSKPLFLHLSYTMPQMAEDVAVVPEEYAEKFTDVNKKNLRQFAGLMSMLDESIGNVTRMLHDAGMLENSIILFMTDSGAPNDKHHSNWPFRGFQGDLWEGSVHGTAFAWSPLIKKTGTILHELMHVTDILPTILRATGYDINKLSKKLNGINMWEVLNSKLLSQRSEILLNIDPVQHSAAILTYYMKMIIGNIRLNGTAGKRWFPPPIDAPTVTAMLSQFNDSSMAPTIQVIVEGLKGNFNLNKTRAKATKCETLNKILKRLEERAVHRMKLMHVDIKEALVELDRQPVLSQPVTLLCEKRTELPVACLPGEAPCIFNVLEDHCEQYNQIDENQHIVGHLLQRLKYFNKTALPLAKQKADPEGLPLNQDGVWRPWVVIPPPAAEVQVDKPDYVAHVVMIDGKNTASYVKSYSLSLMIILLIKITS